jgi:hypothetical protein
MEAPNSARSAAVKIQIAAKDLELVAFQEIGSFPGGEYVCHVEVEPLQDDWTLFVTARDGANLERIQHAVKITTERLKHRYCLRGDW